VVAFIDALSRNAPADQLSIIVLDNASFHTGTNVKDRRQGWEEKTCSCATCRPVLRISTLSKLYGNTSNAFCFPGAARSP
jgi:hypothetical protein